MQAGSTELQHHRKGIQDKIFLGSQNHTKPVTQSDDLQIGYFDVQHIWHPEGLFPERNFPNFCHHQTSSLLPKHVVCTSILTNH